MSVFNLLDQLEHTIENSKKAFMQADKVVVDPEELYAIIDQIRTTLPDDIRDAQWVKKEEEQIKQKAKDDYERLIAEAQAKALEIVSETEIIRLAQKQADEMLDEAHQASKQITLGAFSYANDIMEKIENQLQIYYDVVQDGKDDILKTMETLKKN